MQRDNINIKTGNSLVSRFDLDIDFTEALAKSDFTLEQYRSAILDYQGAKTGEDKQELRDLLKNIKDSFSEEIARGDKRRKNLAIARGRLQNVESALQVGDLFGQAKTKELKAEAKKLRKKVEKLSADFNEAEEGDFYKMQRAFEWRLEFPAALDENGKFVGFDVVVGNPPYIRQEELTSLKPYLKTNFKVYRGTSDILTYFVELGLNLVRDGGQFSYIISNKFMRAGYGKELREYLLDYDLQELIDFGDLQGFNEATTYPMIMIISKQPPTQDYVAANVEQLMPLAFRQNLQEIQFTGNTGSLASDGWSLTDSATFERLQNLRSKGVPLGEFVNGKIFYGIKTGYNQAFVINEPTAQRLIDAHPSSEEVIKPFLAGRDIKRYRQPVADKYLIKFERGQTKLETGIYKDESAAHLVMQDKYPAVFEWLNQHEVKAKARYDQGEYWWELRSCDYWQEFEKPKIMYQEIATYSQFTYDAEALYANNKVFILPEQPLWLLAMINSSIIWEYIKFKGTTYNGGAVGMQSPMISSIPIVEPDGETREGLDRLVEARMGLDVVGLNKGDEIGRIESEIEGLVGKIYNLNTRK